MAEETHRSSAAEISVTSNGDLDQSPDSVFQRVRAHLEWSDTLGGKDVFRTRTLLRDGPCIRATHVGKLLRLLCGSSCKCIYRSLEKKLHLAGGGLSVTSTLWSRQETLFVHLAWFFLRHLLCACCLCYLISRATAGKWRTRAEQR